MLGRFTSESEVLPMDIMKRARRADEDPDENELAWQRPDSLPDFDETSPPNAEDLEEEPVNLDELPANIRQSIEEHMVGVSSMDVVRMTSAGITWYYNAIGRRGKTAVGLTISFHGEVVEQERQVSASRLPKAVRETLKLVPEEILIDPPTQVTLHFYEMGYTTPEGERRVLQIDPAGRLLQDVPEDEA